MNTEIDAAPELKDRERAELAHHSGIFGQVVEPMSIREPAMGNFSSRA